ncbi:SET domain protein [Toxoplasma gondii TgCatPRC2]|uniref:SET domain protein n=1 Tax=Toxoplasma gondii TgCatPRC2 TaxID=1130821 RepID=A0A151H182_TOXGO|nr:SET domain protein [Toxoplasma gondii TgCatPRC2]
MGDGQADGDTRGAARQTREQLQKGEEFSRVHKTLTEEREAGQSAWVVPTKKTLKTDPSWTFSLLSLVLARYINDNAKKEKLNARFVKDKERRRVFVQALRDLEAGEEIYASYGEGYWRNRPFFASGDGSKQLLPGEALEEEDEERKGRSFGSSKEEKPEREGALGGRETQREQGEEK